MDDTKQTKVINRIHADLKEEKHAINTYFATLKLKLPTQIKNLTLSQLRHIGGAIDPDIRLPKVTGENIRVNVDYSRKYAQIVETIKTMLDEKKQAMGIFYANMKYKIPKETLKKKLSELDDKEKMICFGKFNR